MNPNVFAKELTDFLAKLYLVFLVVESSFGGGSGGAGININTSDDTMIFGDKQYKLIPVVEE